MITSGASVTTSWEMPLQLYGGADSPPGRDQRENVDDGLFSPPGDERIREKARWEGAGWVKVIHGLHP